MEKNVPLPLGVDAPLPEPALSERLWMVRKTISCLLYTSDAADEL